MRRALHLAGRAGVVAGIGGAVVGLAAAPALAATASLSVTPTGTVDHNVVIKASGSYDNSTSLNSQTLNLKVDRPDSSSSVLYTGSAKAASTGTTPTESVDTSALNLNGNYVITFTVGSTSTSKTVTMRVPPATVANFNGSASGTVAHFTWTANTEPDLAGYDVIDVTDRSNPRDLTPGGVGTNVCDSSGCSVDIDFGSGAQGTTRSFVIDALRYTSPAHSATISSGDSSTATVNFPAPPPPSSSGGSSGGDSSGGSAASGSGNSSGSGSSSGSTGSTSRSGSSGGTKSGSATGGRTSGGSSGRGINSDHPNAALKAYLPSFSAASAPDLPSVITEVKPLPEGTYKPTLAYPDQVVGETVQHKDTKPVAAVREELVRVLNVSAVWKSFAGAVLVLLMAAHLRAWVASVDGSDS
jgi:hypothetical protein